MRYYNFSKTINKWNEDSSFVCEDFGFVIDGAAPVYEEKFSEKNSDSEWLSNELKEYLIENLAKDKSIFDILKCAVRTLSIKFKKLAGDKIPKDYPSATVSIVRRHKGQIEFYCLGDSPIVVLTKIGKSFLVNDNRNNINDAINLTQIEMMAKSEKISFIDARNKFPDVIRSGRRRKNTKGFYFVFSDKEESIDEGYLFTMPENLVSKIMILSDGYSQVFDTVGFLTSNELIKKTKSLKDIETNYNKLVKFQKSDLGGNKFQRTKVSDDATLVMLDFEN